MNSGYLGIHVRVEELESSVADGMPGPSPSPKSQPRQELILIQGGRREDLVTCEQIVQAADERRLTRATINAVILSTFFMVGAFALIELVLHCDEIFRP
jgi:hypothetical protein